MPRLANTAPTSVAIDSLFGAPPGSSSGARFVDPLAAPAGQPTADAASEAILRGLLAPPPVIDRYPTVIGAGLSVGVITNAMRQAMNGWRYQFVDVLNELFEHDPHSRGSLRARVLPVAGARVEVFPAKLPESAPASEKKLAKEIADEVERQLACIPALTQSLAALAWGAIYGVSGAEIAWRRAERWEVSGLGFIHSRRLNFTNPVDNSVYVWDQGTVGPGLGSYGVTNGPYGLRCSAFPGKFVVHAPQLAADYPWRDGEGRYIATYLMLKRMTVRATAQDFERVIRPWIVGYFKRGAEGQALSFANREDISTLNAAVQAIGNGSLNTAVVPDACTIEVVRAASEYPIAEWLAFLNDEISKAILGQTYTTSPGTHGNQAAAEVAKESTLDVLRYDARCLADSLERDLVRWIVKLNWPGKEDRFCPRLTLNVDEETTPAEMMDLALSATKQDVPVDVKQLAERTGLPIVDVGADDYDPILSPRTRLVQSGGPNGAVNPTSDGDPNEQDVETPAPTDDVAGPATAAPKKGADAKTPKPKPAPKKAAAKTPKKPTPSGKE